MLKKTTLALLMLATLLRANAQLENTEAKAAYLLAEEAYNGNDFKTALNYLQECKTKIGKANGKILYLELLTQMEMAKQDSHYYDAVLKTIDQFETAPDVKQFNEDKVLEVMKIKLRVRDMRKREAEEAAYAKGAAERFSRFQIDGWPVGITYKDLKAQKENEAFFKNRVSDQSGTLKKSRIYYITSGQAAYNVSPIRRIFVLRDTVMGYRQCLASTLETTKFPTDQDLRKQFRQVIEEYTKEFGFPPLRRTPVEAIRIMATPEEEYYWTVSGKTVSLLYLLVPPNSGGFSAILLDVKTVEGL